MASHRSIGARPVFVAGILGAFAIAAASPAQTPNQAVGVVFDDRNGNRRREASEPGIEGVGVSNGREVVETDAQGRYSLPVTDDTMIFIIKPRGWRSPLSEVMMPRFYYNHKPNGSPPSRYAGVEPTGPLPASVDFPLYPNPEPDRFEALLFGDTQPRDLKEVDYIAHDVVEELIGADYTFGVTLGDVVFDDLSVMEPLNQVIATIGIPWHNIIGNHDINLDAPDDRLSDETWERIYGPAYYSFNYGPVHFIALDDVEWTGPTEGGGRGGRGGNRGSYRGGLGADQLEFIKNDLALVPEDQLLVLFMHIPLTSRWNTPEREALYRIIERRPLTFSVSAHTHYQAHQFLTEEDGWRGVKPHHHLINVTVCGSWWSGEPDELGIPIATMSHGAPNGYSIVAFDSAQYSVRYKASRRPEDYQMNVFAPNEVAAGQTSETEVLVNVFAGSERSTVEMRLGAEGAWRALERVRRPDPYFVVLKEREAQQAPPPGYRRLPDAANSLHLWRGVLPADLAPGVHLINVRTTDMFGQTYSDHRLIRVAPNR